MTPAQVRQSVALRQIGHTLPEIAEITGLKADTVGKCLKMLGVKKVPGFRPNSVSPKMVRRLTRLALRGYSQMQMARKTGLTLAQVAGIFRRYRLREEQCLLLPSEVADSIGVSPHALWREVRCGRLKATRWMTRSLFTSDQAEAARAYFSEHIDVSDAAGWYTVDVLAAALGLSVMAFNKRRRTCPVLQSITRRKLVGQGAGGNTYRFSPADVHRVLMHWERKADPKMLKRQGYLMTKQLADLAEVSPDAVSLWVRKGLSHQTDVRNRHWLSPGEVLAWLKQRSDPRYQVAAQRLDAALSTQKEEAC